ncbi:ImmA/IrrE family metallo-endopeptidase [Bullifex sp.]|uniref:ImmA/IrrE family metallo-endopeptidase n=1 Tax=Bullifex sp. TaxID=2815808 RepID=UPI002A8389A8|nr:ImmA/IrrE family metallo-endopeptidase [Bullifex sp.]MDY4067825.1 ImmA/IrrE family metallo-endopeptidase [Bullifex sp.]
MKTLELTEAEALKVKDYAASKLGVCRKMNDIIGTQIFQILSLHARVIYYPLGKESVWGFTRIKGARGGGQSQKPFVVINSSIPIDCQVFAAAHELYHIWEDDKVDVVPAYVMDDETGDRNELKANRFAAEFLVEEELLIKELRTYGIASDNVSLKEILILSELFCVPYRTMVKRLFEIGFITKTDRNRFLNASEQEVMIARKRYALSIPQGDEKIAIDNLTELAVDAYENKRITFEKLEYLLDISNLKPVDVGISESENNPFPSDDELDKIMEE